MFVVCSLTCALAPSTGWLIAARAAQGVGAALLVPSSLALLNAAYPHRAARRRAFAVWAGVAGIGAGAGPVVGGVLVSMLGWRSVFFLNIPIGLAGLVLVAVVVRSTARTRSGSNPAGQAALMIGLAALTAGLVQAGSTGWRSRVVLASFAVAIAAGIAFMLIRAPVPLLPRGLFASQEFSSGTFVGCCINLGFYGELFVMTLYLQQNRGYSSLLTGIALLPQMAMIVVGSAISGRLLARRGPRQMMLIGLGLGAAGLAALTIAGTHTPYALLVGPFMATVLGMAITMPATTMPATTAVVMDAAPPERAGAGIGDPQRRAPNRRRARRGPAGQGLVTNKAAFTTGLHAGVLVAGGTYLAGLIATVLVVGRPTNRRCESRANISDLAGRHQRYVTSHESPCPRTTVKPEEPRCACRYCLQPA